MLKDCCDDACDADGINGRRSKLLAVVAPTSMEPLPGTENECLYCCWRFWLLDCRGDAVIVVEAIR